MNGYLRRYCPRVFRVCATILLALAFSGCSHDGLSDVTGRVTLDGQPVADAFVQFIPQTTVGSPAYGRTNSDGVFEMKYSISKTGSKPGDYAVRITTADIHVKDGRDVAVPERIPARYNSRSELTVTIEEGRNKRDFELLSANQENAGKGAGSRPAAGRN